MKFKAQNFFKKKEWSSGNNNKWNNWEIGKERKTKIKVNHEGQKIKPFKQNFISFHFTSFHFISFQFISFHFISFHFISCHFISCHFISCHFISFHFILFTMFKCQDFKNCKAISRRLFFTWRNQTQNTAILGIKKDHQKFPILNHYYHLNDLEPIGSS